MPSPLERFANAILKVPIASFGAAVQDSDGNYVAPNAGTIEYKAQLKKARPTRPLSEAVDQTQIYLTGRVVAPLFLDENVSLPVECDCEINMGRGVVKGRLQLEITPQEAFAGRQVEETLGQGVQGTFYVRGSSDG